MSYRRLNQFYIWFIIAAGAWVLVSSANQISRSQIDVRFMLLALATILIGPRLSIQIPRVRAHISASDTFIFVALLLFGGEAAIYLATAEALCASLRLGSRPRTHLFNAGVMACATFFTVWALRLVFGDTATWHALGSSDYLVSLCLMAVMQYFGNSLLVAVNSALESDESVWASWRKKFMWSSITYFAGACAAGIIARFIGNVGFFAFSATIPIVVIVYFTYLTYMKNVESASIQAETARRHVEELNRSIAEQERVSRALRETEEQFRNAFDYAAIGMALVSPQGVWLRVNRSLCDLVGYSEKEMLASNFQQVTHEEDVGSDLANLYRLLQGEIPTCKVEKRYVHREGHVVWALNNVSLVRDTEDRPVHFIFQIQDITERKRAEAALQSMSIVDELTGLYNRRGFLAVTDQHMAAIRRHEKMPVILYGDLDGLKRINDSYGHREGDRALVKTAELFKETFRSSDIMARLGGDEFIVLAGVTAEEGVESLASRLQERFREHNATSGDPYALSISIGVTPIEPHDVRSTDELMAHADRAMYQDKRSKSSRGTGPLIDEVSGAGCQVPGEPLVTQQLSDPIRP